MNATKRWHPVVAFVTLCVIVGWSQFIVARPASGVSQDGVEVLTRGPVHEAFAETITFDPQPGIVAPKVPPAAIEEVPPLQRPEGTNVSWIPGYWGWDDERSDYLWISGIWRSLPPGRQWVPGYWDQARQGVQWTSGYWADANATEIQYLPAPPASIEQGPNVAAPSLDQNWLPGNWIWQQNRYAWRPGYWAVGNQDWDWVPDHYVWTPSGYVFVDGYYDYSVRRRGIVFAPVYFDGGLRTQRGFSYSPSMVINPGVFDSNLFLRPGYGHYYFGDYYGSNYANAGYSPWFSYQSSRRGYDPIYINQRWQHRNDRDWERRTESNFRRLRDDATIRPPRTWTAQQSLQTSGTGDDRNRLTIAGSLDDLARSQAGRQRFQPVDKAEREQFTSRGADYRKFLVQRQQLEANAASKTGKDAAQSLQPAQRKLPRSPFVSAPVDQLGGDRVPPKRHEVLKPNLGIQLEPQRSSGPPAINNRQPTDRSPRALIQPGKGGANENAQKQAKPQRAAAREQQGQNVNRDQSQGTSNRQLQNSSQRPPKSKSKEKDDN